MESRSEHCGLLSKKVVMVGRRLPKHRTAPFRLRLVERRVVKRECCIGGSLRVCAYMAAYSSAPWFVAEYP